MLLVNIFIAFKIGQSQFHYNVLGEKSFLLLSMIANFGTEQCKYIFNFFNTLVRQFVSLFFDFVHSRIVKNNQTMTV
jgi:hypothetical protein